MTIIVCPLSQVTPLIATRRPSHVVTLLPPDAELPQCPGIPAERRLTLLFHDIVEPIAGFVAPDRRAIQSLLAFGTRWDEAAPLLVHCWAGVSRSTAAAFILGCQRGGSATEAHIADALRRSSPSATPNRLMVTLADELLHRGGRMVAAIDAIGRGTDCVEGTPFDLDVPA